MLVLPRWSARRPRLPPRACVRAATCVCLSALQLPVPGEGETQNKADPENACALPPAPTPALLARALALESLEWG